MALTRGDAAAAEDLLQDTWLVALSTSPDRPKSMRAWLLQVLRNGNRQRLRRSTRRSDREVQVARSSTESNTPSELVAEAQVAEVLRGALGRLPESYAQPLRLRFYEGLPPRHIATRMGMPVETIRTRLRRGLDGLRADLNPGDSEHSRRAWLASLAAFGRPARTGLTSGLSAPAWLPLAACAALLALATFFLAHWFGRSDQAPEALVLALQPSLQRSLIGVRSSKPGHRKPPGWKPLRRRLPNQRRGASMSSTNTTSPLWAQRCSPAA